MFAPHHGSLFDEKRGRDACSTTVETLRRVEQLDPHVSVLLSMICDETLCALKRSVPAQSVRHSLYTVLACLSVHKDDDRTVNKSESKYVVDIDNPRQAHSGENEEDSDGFVNLENIAHSKAIESPSQSQGSRGDHGKDDDTASLSRTWTDLQARFKSLCPGDVEEDVDSERNTGVSPHTDGIKTSTSSTTTGTTGISTSTGPSNIVIDREALENEWNEASVAVLDSVTDKVFTSKDVVEGGGAQKATELPGQFAATVGGGEPGQQNIDAFCSAIPLTPAILARLKSQYVLEQIQSGKSVPDVREHDLGDLFDMITNDEVNSMKALQR